MSLNNPNSVEEILQEPFKVTDIFFKRTTLFVVYDQGEYKGQLIKWNGDLTYDGFSLYEFCAQQIEPVTREQAVSYSAVHKVIRDISKKEYPALIQAINEYCDTKPYKISFSNKILNG